HRQYCRDAHDPCVRHRSSMSHGPLWWPVSDGCFVLRAVLYGARASSMAASRALELPVDVHLVPSKQVLLRYLPQPHRVQQYSELLDPDKQLVLGHALTWSG